MNEQEERDVLLYEARLKLLRKVRSFWEGERITQYFVDDEDEYKKMVTQAFEAADDTYVSIKGSYDRFMKEMENKS